MPQVSVRCIRCLLAAPGGPPTHDHCHAILLLFCNTNVEHPLRSQGGKGAHHQTEHYIKLKRVGVDVKETLYPLRLNLAICCRELAGNLKHTCATQNVETQH